MKSKQPTLKVSDARAMKLDRRNRICEAVAAAGMLLVCAAMVSPFFNLFSTELLSIFKWIYLAGAVVFCGARLIGAADPRGSMRLRRVRRMEFWGGIAFLMAAGFWFYNEGRATEFTGSLTILHETIIFTLAGALIQIVASWLIYAVQKKEARKGDMPQP